MKKQTTKQPKKRSKKLFLEDDEVTILCTEYYVSQPSQSP